MVLADLPPGNYLEAKSPAHDRRGAVGSGDVGDERMSHRSTHPVWGAYRRHWEDELRRPPVRGEPGLLSRVLR
jgi:hypothetical protein